MRILHASDCYLPRLGGIEVQVHDLAAHQIEAGDEALVLTCTPAGVDASRKRDSVPVRRITGGIGTLPSAAARDELASILRAGAFDVVHLHSSVFSPFTWAVAQVATRRDVPVVVTMHSVVPSGRLLRLADSLTGWSRSPVIWTAVSDVAARPLREVLGPASVAVLPNGIDPDAWRVPAVRRPGAGLAAELTIASVLRMSRRKRPMALIRMLAGIRAAVPAAVPIRAVLIGDGPQRAKVERFLQLSGMDSWVTLTGRLSRGQIRPLLAAADVYLAPAELESFGIAALEARCAGLPVIAMAAGGVGEFIRDGHEGYLVGSDADMIRVTSELLTSSRLPAMQEHNRCTVPDLAWPRVVGLCRQFYGLAGVGIREGAFAVDAGTAG